MLLPLLQILPDTRQLEIVLVTRKDGTLIGLFPFVRESRYRGLPVPTLSLWSHDFCFLATPLVHKAHARECVEALLDWARTDSKAALLLLGGISGDGAFQHLLIDVLDERDETPWSAMRRTRGLYTQRADADAYLAEVLDGEARRRLRAKERKLKDLGRLEYTAFEPGGDIAEWTAEFLALEAGGWKGREGSAMASESPRQEYFEAIMKAAAERGQLEMLALRLEDRAIAIKCNLRAGDGGFVFKIAYDEAFGKYSPGMLLEVDNIRRMHAQRDVRWMDSCANPRSRLFGEACIERRTIETVLIATHGEIAPLIVATMPLAHGPSAARGHCDHRCASARAIFILPAHRRIHTPGEMIS